MSTNANEINKKFNILVDSINKLATPGWAKRGTEFTEPTAVESSILSKVFYGAFSPLLVFITKWAFIILIIYIIKEFICDIIPEEYRDTCESITQIEDAISNIIVALGEGVDETITAVQQLGVTVVSVIRENSEVADEMVEGTRLLTVMFDTSLDESLTTDRYNWELKSVAESDKFPCPGNDSPCEYDDLSDCVNVNILGNYTRNQFYNKKCYLKNNVDNPNSLNVGDLGNRYEAGREPVEFSGVRFINDENPDRDGRFIPRQGYMSRFRNKELAIQSGELVDVCSLQSMEECNTYHEQGPGAEINEDSYLCQYNENENICKFKENPDCVNKNTVEECDQLNTQNDYKCMYNRETNVCETVPLYSLSSSYDFNIPGRSGTENNYYLGCFADIQGDNDNSGLMQNTDANLCNLDTIKHIVYSDTRLEGDDTMNPYIITKPENFGLTQGTDPYNNAGPSIGPGCASPGEYDQYAVLLDIHPTKYKVPYCFEFNDPRLPGETEGDALLSQLNTYSNYGGSELVGQCGSKSTEEECNSSERCEYVGGECIFKPQRICNESIDCTSLGEDACTFSGLRNICEWVPGNNEPGTEGTCTFKDCVSLSDSYCSSMELIDDLYVSTDCPPGNLTYCPVPEDHEYGTEFICNGDSPCPGSYYRGVDGEIREGGPGASPDNLNGEYTELNNTCYMNCNSDNIGDDVDMYRCPGCTGTNNDLDNDPSGNNGTPPQGDNDPNKCKDGYTCVRDENYPGENVCVNQDSLQSLSGSLVQAELCFSPPIVAGDNNVNRYNYWNFGQFVATAPSADQPATPTCNKGNDTVDNLYIQDRGFSPIIQTLFGDLDKVPFIDEDHNDDLSICINKNPEEKSIYNCKYQNLELGNCNPSYCKKVHRFDANTMIRGGNEDSICGDPTYSDSSHTCFNNHYIGHLECYEGTNIGDETDNERLHRCREMRYNTLRDNMIHLRKFLNININEEDEHIILSHITDGQTSNGIPTIGSIHPCANENAYLEFYRNLHHLKNSINPEDRNKYRQAICLLNTGTNLTSADHDKCNPLEVGTTWTSIMPKTDATDVDKLLRGWVHAGEPLTQSQAEYRHNHPDFHGDSNINPQTFFEGYTPGTDDGEIIPFDVEFYGNKLNSDGHCISTYHGQNEICNDINSESAPTQSVISQGLSLLGITQGETTQITDDEYKSMLCQGQSGCQWNNNICSVSPEVQTIIDDSSCQDKSQSECYNHENCQYEIHGLNQPIDGLDKIHDHYRKEYGNMLEQLCHYRVEYNNQSDSENLDLSSIRYGPIITGDAGENLCSPCRYKGDSQANRCSKFRDDQTLECVSSNTQVVNTFRASQVSAGGDSNNICNEDGSCRCDSLNTDDNPYKWYLENHGSDEINRKCRTSSAPTCENGKDLLYSNDNYNEAVFGVEDEDANPLCDCRGDDPNNILYFGPNCSKADRLDSDDADINSCHGRYSEYEFSFDGTDYRKIEYINNKINLLNEDNEIFYILLKYLRIRIKHALENGGHDSPLYKQFFGQPIGGGGNIQRGTSFWKNIEERSKKRIHRQLSNINHFSPIDSVNPDSDWEGDYDSSKDHLLLKFPFDLKDILLEIHENGWRYSPTEGGESKDDYIFPNHLGSTRQGSRKSMAETGGESYSPWNIGETNQDNIGNKKIYSPDSLFYDFYRNSGLGPTLCDCTRDDNGDYFNDGLYGAGGSDTFGSLGRSFEWLYNYQAPYPMTGDVSKGHNRQDNYIPSKLFTYWNKEPSGKWGYRCELETECSAGEAINAGKPVYSSLGWSLPSELGGRSTTNSGSGISARSMNNFNLRDNWRYKNSLGNDLWVNDGFRGSYPSYNTFYPIGDHKRLEYGGPGDVEGCKYLDTETQQAVDCVLDDSAEPYGTTWDQIKVQRTSLEIENKSPDDLKYDVSIESGKLPDYFDLKGHKPLLCDCSHSLTEDNYNQPGDSNSPSFGDYCELATNQLATVSGTPRNSTRFNQAWTNWDESGEDGICNPQNLLPLRTLNNRIHDIYSNAIQSEAQGGALRFIPAPDNDCSKISQLQIEDSTAPYYFPEARDDPARFLAVNRENGYDLNGISYKWSCENQSGRNGDDCDPNIGPCMCYSGLCKNQTSSNDIVFSPINYELLNENAYSTRDNFQSGDIIFEREIDIADTRGISSDDIHPLTKADYRLINNRTKLNNEFYKRGIERVRGDVKNSLCNCDVDMIQNPNAQGCNLQNTTMCNGHGNIYTNSAGYPACDCESGYTGVDCNSCDSNHWGYPNCQDKLPAGGVCGAPENAERCINSSRGCTRYGYGFDYTCN